jgi:hypothetical protein
MQKRVIADKRSRGIEGIAITQRLGLGHKMQPPYMVTRDRRVGGFIAGAHHQRNAINPRLHHLVEQYMQDGSLYTIAVDECLQGQCTLAASGCGNHGFGNLHGFDASSWER